jgi:hypothetical protein
MAVKIIRSDFIFSYWIFAWFLLYYFNIVKYSPKFVIILGIIENCFLLLFLIIYKSTLYKITKFIIINTIIKVIPLYLVWNDKIIKKDIYATIILFLIYLVWIYLNGGIEYFYISYKKLIKNYMPKLKSQISSSENKEATLLSYIYDNIFRQK